MRCHERESQRENSPAGDRKTRGFQAGFTRSRACATLLPGKLFGWFGTTWKSTRFPLPWKLLHAKNLRRGGGMSRPCVAAWFGAQRTGRTICLRRIGATGRPRRRRCALKADRWSGHKRLPSPGSLAYPRFPRIGATGRRQRKHCVAKVDR